MQKTKRIVSLFITLCMLMSLVPYTMVYADSTFSGGGSGTENDPYIIANADDFIKLATDVNNNGITYQGTYFKVSDEVTEPIVLTTDGGFSPIGTSSNKFNGTFDGNDKTVTLNLDLSTTDYVGLFGYCDSKSVIKNVTTTGTVKGRYGVGGIAGYSSGKIINCQNQAAVTSTENCIGGIVGKSGTIINCQNQANVEGALYVGGISGSDATVINCLNTGTVTGGQYTGGIVGSAGLSLTNCVNNGKVTASSTSPVGGIAGWLNSYEPTNCYYNETKNDGIYDAGYESNNSACTTKNYAVSEFSETVLDTLNLYARDNKAYGIELLYWKASGDVISFTSEAPESFPYKITNNSDAYITVDGCAKAGTTVTITVTAPSSCLLVTGVTVKDANNADVATTKTTETSYTFTMPESDVTVSATAEIKLNQTDGVYQITSAEEMKILSDAVNAGYDTKNKSFKLTSNVSLSSTEGFSPIGTSANKFNGTFDGNGKTVTLNLDLSTDYVGLFGYCYSSSVIKNVTTTGTVKGGAYVGGIAGYSSGTIINCQNQAAVTSTGNCVGGIVGSSGTIINCQNQAAVTGNQYVGGISGSEATVTNCLNTGTVTGAQPTGGIVGYAFYLTNCVNNGKVTASGTKSVGGIAGKFGSYEPTNCYYNSTMNEGICDAGYESDGTACTTKKYAVSETDIVSEDVLGTLNLYARDNTAYNIELLYWKASGNVISLTSEAPQFSYPITNNSEYLTVASTAKNGDSVEITVGEIPEYMQLVKITVNGEEVSKNAEGKYIFTMPNSNVKVDAEVNLKLTELEDGSYEISTAEELKTFAKAVNGGVRKVSATLTADITASTADGFEPISNWYEGDFNGNGHTLTLNITADDSTETGLFGAVLKASIHDLILKGSVDGGNNTDSYTGALFGASLDYVYVYNVYSEAAVSGSGYVGGIAGNGNREFAELRNVVNNGTVTQKNTDEDKKAVGAIIGVGNGDYRNVYYNSEKNSGIYDSGYDNEGNAVTSDNANVKAKTEAELFSDEVMDELNGYVYNSTQNLMFWDISAAERTVKFAKECHVPLYELYRDDMSDACIDVPAYSRAGKTITVTTNVNEAYSDMIKAITGIKVTDSKGNVIDVTKTADNTYEFVMPEKDVSIQVVFEYNIEKDSEGVYCIEDVADLFIFSLIAAEQPDANAKVTAETIDIRELGGLISVNIDGLIGHNTAYKGTFDGNGAQISWYGALFGKTDGAVIKNINIYTSYSGPSFAGVVKNAKNTRIDNCNAKIGFYAASAAGIVLEATDSVITNCSVTAGQSSRADYGFGGIVGVTSGNTVVANCVVNDCMVDTMRYGGIVAEAHDKTEIYNCVNQDRSASNSNLGAGAIVCMAEMSGLTLENNLYYNVFGYNDVRFDDDWNMIYEMTDKNSAVDMDDVSALYIPAKLNEYIEENPELIEGTALNKWSNDYDSEHNINLACFADDTHPEIYSIKQTDIIVNTLVNGSKVYGAVAGAEVTVEVPSSAEVTVTDKDGNNVVLSDEGVFTMPEGSVTVSVVMDSGIEETTKIDGKTYAVVRNADDFINAVKSIAAGYNTLNVYIAEDITLAAADLANYPVYDGSTPAYNGTFDGAGHTVTFDGLTMEGSTAMLALIGKKGVVKNLTVDGTIGGSTASAVAYINAGTIINCINKSAISGETAAGIVCINEGTIFNCINKGDISGSFYSAAIAYENTNKGEVAFVANECTISNPSESGNSFIANGKIANMCIDLSAETEKSAWEEGAATLNGALEEKKAYVSLFNDCKEWSVAETDTSAEIVFADEENAPYYMLTTPDGYKPYKAGSTVEVTFDTSKLDEGFVISSATVQAKYADEEFDAAPVEGKKNTFSFTMPAKTCQIVMNVEPADIEKDDDGCYLVSTLDDLIKVKQTIEYGNNGINIKLMNNIEGYDGDPIGGGYGYSGIFDGNGYSVTLAMSDDEGYWNEYGLFTVLNSDAVVKNLTIEGSVEANADYMGAVAGKSSGTITDCVNNAAVTNNEECAGGIVGSVEGLKTNPAKLTNCVNNGKVTGDDAGGIVYYIKDYVVITSCVNNGDVYADHDDAGGIAAQGENVEIINCINSGNVSGDYAGGIISSARGNSVINNCINNGDVDAYNSAGGIVGHGGGDLTIKNCYNGGNVTGDYDVYAIAYYNTYYDVNMIILNSFYLQTEDINARLESSNLENGNDFSEAVTEDDIISGYVAAKLNSGVMEGLHRWDVKDDKLVFAEEGSKLYYEVTINENITGGSVTADKAFARAGETVTLTITPDKAGQSAMVTGVELDENNSFVMPNEPVGIFAVFGDAFKGTEKSDVIELLQNVEMEEIKLADYVKFENADIAREFTFTLAEGSVLPDGLTLSSGKISGTPTQLGRYTVVFDVTDSGTESAVSLMALEPDTAVGSAKLTLTFNISDVQPEATPEIKVDYVNETLTGFVDGASYKIGEETVTVENGVVPVANYMGKTVSIVRKGNGTSTLDSAAQTLEIPARPTAPTESDFTVTQPSEIGETGSIAGITAAMEYSTDGGTTWTDGDSTVTDIPGGTTYWVRYKATASSFKSDSYVIVIGEGTAEEITPIGKYADKITIDNEVVGDKAVFTITPLDGNADEVSSVTLYLAEYNDNGQLISAKLGENQIVDGKLTITSDLPETNNYKFILWDIDQCPLIDAIANIY